MLNVLWRKYWSMLPLEAPALLANKEKEHNTTPYHDVITSCTRALQYTHNTAAQHPTTFLTSSLVLCSLHKLYRNSTQVQNDNPGLTCKTLSPFQLSQISFPCCIWSKVALQCLWPAFNFSWLFFFLFAYCIVNIIQRQTWKKITKSIPYKS